MQLKHNANKNKNVKFFLGRSLLLLFLRVFTVLLIEFMESGTVITSDVYCVLSNISAAEEISEYKISDVVIWLMVLHGNVQPHIVAAAETLETFKLKIFFAIFTAHP